MADGLGWQASSQWQAGQAGQIEDQHSQVDMDSHFRLPVQKWQTSGNDRKGPFFKALSTRLLRLSTIQWRSGLYDL